MGAPLNNRISDRILITLNRNQISFQSENFLPLTKIKGLSPKSGKSNGNHFWEQSSKKITMKRIFSIVIEYKRIIFQARLGRLVNWIFYFTKSLLKSKTECIEHFSFCITYYFWWRNIMVYGAFSFYKAALIFIIFILHILQ